MSDELIEIVDNIKQPSVWIRVLFMIVFALASYIIILPLVLVLSIAQALFVFVTGDSNANLRYFSATLELYVSQIIKFLTYLSEVKPFPFSGLPEVEVDSLQEAPASRSERNKPPGDNSKAATPAAKKAAANKSASIKPAKEKVAKKKAAKKTEAKKKTAKKSSAPIAASAKKVEDEGSAAS